VKTHVKPQRKKRVATKLMRELGRQLREIAKFAGLDKPEPQRRRKKNGKVF
jgi:hypothetical protein